MPVPDIFRDGLARGWTTYNGARLDKDLLLEADVAIIGSGAGGGTAAEILSLAGLKVLLLEEGALRTSDSFRDMDEARLVSALCISLYLWFGSLLEERKLLACHGEAYARYRQRVPGLIPLPGRALSAEEARTLERLGRR